MGSRHRFAVSIAPMIVGLLLLAGVAPAQAEGAETDSVVGSAFITDGVVPKSGSIAATLRWINPYADGVQTLTEDITIREDGDVLLHTTTTGVDIVHELPLTLAVGHRYSAMITFDFSTLQHYAMNPDAYPSTGYLDLTTSNVPDPVYAPSAPSKVSIAPCRDRGWEKPVDGHMLCASWFFDPKTYSGGTPTGFALSLKHDGKTSTVLQKIDPTFWDAENQQSYTFRNVPSSTSVVLSVSAVNSTGASAPKSSASLNNRAPARVTGLTLGKYKTKWSATTLHWKKPSANGGTKVIGYNIELEQQNRRTRKWDQAGPIRPIATGKSIFTTNSAHFFTGFAGGCVTRNIKFRVQAINSTQSVGGGDWIQGSWSKWRTFTVHDPFYDGPGSSPTFYPAMPRCH